MIVTALVLAGASLALSLIVFRGTTLLGWLAFDAGSWAVALVVFLVARPPDVRFALIAFGVLKLAAFSVVLGSGREVRWSATRAAALAAIVYALAIPTQMLTPVDGDEPFYLLLTESLVRDHDFDLANQYRDLAHSATGRTDLKPQLGDPIGRHGEQYSRHEPFLPMLLIPGYIAGALPGALATIALFGVLLARSTVRLLEDEGIDDGTIRALFPFFAFAPPILFYAVRIWPEVPGAFCFVEALRGVRQQRLKRALPALFALVMLKLRFVLIGIVLAGAIFRDRARQLKTLVRSRYTNIAIIIAVPLLVVWIFSGHLLNVHSWRELMPYPLHYYATGAFGLLLDGAAGVLFHAPFYLLGIFALTHWRSMPPAFRLGTIAALPYVVSLLPRSEWHGGWSPPVRYIVVFMPLLFLGAAALLGATASRPLVRSLPAAGDEGRRDGGAAAGVTPSFQSGSAAFLSLAALWTIGLAIHGLAYPWRLFHIENGENPVGEWLSTLHHSDFSRLFPSFIRLNHAAIVASVALLLAFVLFRFVRVPATIIIPAAGLLLAIGYARGQTAAPIVEFEDAHVIHNGGELYPEMYTVARFFYRSGWRLRAGDSVSFLTTKGDALLEYACGTPVTIELDGNRYTLPATANDHWAKPVTIHRTGRVTLRSLDGVVNIDRLRHE